MTDSCCAVWKTREPSAVCHAACLMVLLRGGTADGAALVQLHPSLVEILLRNGDDGGAVLSAMLGLVSAPAAPFPLASSTSASCLS